MASVPSNAATRPYTGLPLPLHSSIGLTQAYTTDVGTHTVREQPMSCFAVKMRPTPHQRRLLDAHVCAANHAYNWCLWLVENG